jgi:hypothetical protein
MSSLSPASVIVDENGNKVGVVIDGVSYRLQTATKIESWFGSTAPTVGEKTKSESIPVVFASDQRPIAIFVDSPEGSRTGITTGSVALAGGTAGTVVPIRSTAYNEQLVNGARSLNSSSTSDSGAGTGARSVEITYFNQALEGPFTETVTLNGTSAVATSASDICFVEKMVVKTVGSTGFNLGTITLYVNNVGSGGVIGTIGLGTIAAGVGDNSTYWGHHYVPVGIKASLSTFVAAALSGGSGTNATMLLRAKNPISIDAPDLAVGDLLRISGGIVRTLSNPIRIDGPSRITAIGIPSVNNATLNASFDFAETSI